LTQESYWNDNYKSSQERVKTQTVTRWCIKENWKLPVFSTDEGRVLTQRVVL